MIRVKIISEENKADINIPNQPFKLFGRMIPSYMDEKWSFETVRFTNEDVTEMCFPDENYDWGELSKNSVCIGAYDGERCVGLAILQQAWFKYMYLYDLKVNSEYRGQNVGRMLIEEAKQIAVEQGYCGLYTQGQDNNLGACLFYVKNGFSIGGLDTNVYKGTPQEGKSDILFYLDMNF